MYTKVVSLLVVQFDLCFIFQFFSSRDISFKSIQFSWENLDFGLPPVVFGPILGRAVNPHASDSGVEKNSPSPVFYGPIKFWGNEWIWRLPPHGGLTILRPNNATGLGAELSPQFTDQEKKINNFRYCRKFFFAIFPHPCTLTFFEWISSEYGLRNLGSTRFCSCEGVFG